MTGKTKKKDVVRNPQVSFSEMSQNEYMVEISDGTNEYFAGVIGMDDDGNHVYRQGKTAFKTGDGLDAVKTFLEHATFTKTGDSHPILGESVTWRNGASRKFNMERVPYVDEFEGIRRESIRREFKNAVEKFQESFHVEW